MKLSLARRLKEWLFLTVAWTLLTLIFSGLIIGTLRYFISLIGIEELARNHELASYMASNYQFLEAVIFGVLFGSMFFLINVFTDDSRLHRQSFYKIIMIKSGLYLVAIALISLVISTLFLSLDIISINMLEDVTLWKTDPWLIILFGIFLVLCIVLVNFIQVINKKFGPGQTLAILFGKYHQPQIEQRIFMFLDLKSSTTYAEQLGHLRYSLMIQDCFFDLNRLLIRRHASVYQYVGDEAVLTWKYNEGLKDGNCVRIFFDFQALLQKRASYYQRRYGIVPEFKAGLNGGEITVAEVGNVKKEIAYHGDVLNTAARIRDLCNKIDCKLLLTNQLAQHLMIVNHFDYKAEGEYMLRGKGEKIQVFSAHTPAFKRKPIKKIEA